MTNHDLSRELVIETNTVEWMIAAAPAPCPRCESIHLLHVGPGDGGDLDAKVVLGHEPSCPTRQAAHDRPAEPEPTLTDFGFRLGEQLGRITAKVDRLLELNGIDPDGPEVAAAVEAAQSRNRTIGVDLATSTCCPCGRPLEAAATDDGFEFRHADGTEPCPIEFKENRS